MEVNLDKIIKHKLSLEGYLICWCLYNEESSILLNYVNNVNKIPIHIFSNLVSEGWLLWSGDIISSDPSKSGYNLDNIELTEKFSKEVLEVISNKNLTFDECFQQLRDHYPIKAGNSERRLHGDLERCKNLYKTTIIKNGKIDDELHSVILQCINFEINLRSKAKSLEYFQLLATWLSQKTWKLYIEDVEEVIRKNGFVSKKEENSGGFSEDV